MSWVKRVEAVLDVLKGSSISEIELAEGELEIILRRSPGTVVTVTSHQHRRTHLEPVPLSDARATAIKAPLTGVYYASPSPTVAAFVNVGDVIKIGQTIALIEAMKVFSEISADAAGRVVAINVQSGDVVKKGDTLLQVEPI